MYVLFQQIKRSDVDFLKSGNTAKSMERKHKRKMYPPRITITVASKTAGISPVVKVTTTFEGSSSDEDLNQDIILPLGMHKTFMTTVLQNKATTCCSLPN